MKKNYCLTSLIGCIITLILDPFSAIEFYKRYFRETILSNSLYDLNFTIVEWLRAQTQTLKLDYLDSIDGTVTYSLG